ERDGRWIGDLLVLDLALRLVALAVFLAVAFSFARWFPIAAVREVPGVVLLLAALAHFLNKAGNPVALGLLRVMDRFDTAAAVVALEWLGKLVSLAAVAWLAMGGKDAAELLVWALAWQLLIGFASNAALCGLARVHWRLAHPGSPAWLGAGWFARL